MPDHPKHRSDCRARRAFSLVELMVAMAVLAVLVVLLLSMVDSATKLWRESENRVDSYREARVALNIIASDLQSLFPSREPDHFEVDKEGGVLSPAPDSSNVFFLSAKPLDAQDTSRPENRSDICSVGYFLNFGRTSAQARESSNLYRYFQGSGATFEAIRNGNLFAGIAAGPPSSDLLARNVTRFSVTPWTLDEQGNPVEFVQSDDRPLPDILEISITAINQQAAGRLQSRADWQNRESQTMREAERTFTTRVRLNAPPPTPAP